MRAPHSHAARLPMGAAFSRGGATHESPLIAPSTPKTIALEVKATVGPYRDEKFFVGEDGRAFALQMPPADQMLTLSVGCVLLHVDSSGRMLLDVSRVDEAGDLKV
jgi:hypothetical protein